MNFSLLLLLCFFSTLSLFTSASTHSHTHAFIHFYLIRVPTGCHICAQCQEGADRAEFLYSSSCLVGAQAIEAGHCQYMEGNPGTMGCTAAPGGKTVSSHISKLIHKGSQRQEGWQSGCRHSIFGQLISPFTHVTLVPPSITPTQSTIFPTFFPWCEQAPSTLVASTYTSGAHLWLKALPGTPTLGFSLRVLETTHPLSGSALSVCVPHALVGAATGPEAEDSCLTLPDTAERSLGTCPPHFPIDLCLPPSPQCARLI